MIIQWTFHTFEKILSFHVSFFFVNFTLLSSKSISSLVDGSYINTYNLMHGYI
jgi:hypothetical protein